MDSIIAVAEAAQECFGPPLATAQRRRPSQRELPAVPTRLSQHRAARRDLVPSSPATLPRPATAPRRGRQGGRRGMDGLL